MFPEHPQENEIIFITQENILVIVSLVLNVVYIIGEEFHFELQFCSHGLTEV
jgi:hypothetical protein